MPIPDHEFERSIVAIWVDGRAVGTGFVIGPQAVLTCAHVVPALADSGPADGSPADNAARANPKSRARNSAKPVPKSDASGKIEIEFYAAPSGTPRQVVEIDPQRYSSPAKHDIAVLTWSGPLPADVQPAKFSKPDSLVDLLIRSRGFPHLGEFRSQAATGKVIGRTSSSETDGALWTLESGAITSGFSGAPIVDATMGVVVGMARAVIPPDGNWRNATTAIAVGVPTLIAVCGDKLSLVSAEAEARFAEAIGRIRNAVVDALVRHPAALRPLAERLRVQRSAPKVDSSKREVEDLARQVAEQLISGQRTLSDVRAPMREVFKLLAGSGDQHAAAAVATAYLAYVSSSLEPELGRLLHEKLLDGNRRFDVPASTPTAIELVMAQLDGRVPRFRPDIEPGRPPRGVRNMPLPAEAGIQDNWDEFESRWMESLTDFMGVKLDELPKDAQRNLLNSLLGLAAEGNERAYGIDNSTKRKLSESVAAELHRQYPEFALVNQRPPNVATDKRQSDAIAPLLLGELLPKSEKKS